jgi:hypothetical protein
MVIASDPTDLVVDTIGQGTGIDSPGSGQTSRFVRNVDTTNTQNNTAASTAPGASSLALTWNFTGMPDEWQGSQCRFSRDRLRRRGARRRPDFSRTRATDFAAAPTSSVARQRCPEFSRHGRCATVIR